MLSIVILLSVIVVLLIGIAITLRKILAELSKQASGSLASVKLQFGKPIQK